MNILHVVDCVGCIFDQFRTTIYIIKRQMLCSLNCSCYYLCLVVVKFPLIAGYEDFECKQ